MLLNLSFFIVSRRPRCHRNWRYFRPPFCHRYSQMDMSLSSLSFILEDDLSMWRLDLIETSEWRSKLKGQGHIEVMTELTENWKHVTMMRISKRYMRTLNPTCWQTIGINSTLSTLKSPYAGNKQSRVKFVNETWL